MKKTIAVLLSALMILGLAACGDSSSHNEDFLDLKITAKELSEDWGSVPNAVKGEFEVVELNEPPASLQALFDELNAHNEIVTSLMEDNMERLEEDLDSMSETDANAVLPLSCCEYPYISRADDVLSYIEKWMFNGQGTHSTSLFTTNNYYAKTGQSLELSDVVTDVAEFQKEVAKKFDETHPGWQYTKPQAIDLWLLADGGMFVIWDYYKLAPYSEGFQYVFMPFGEYSSLMNSGFFITPQGWLDGEINRYGERSAYKLLSTEGDGWGAPIGGEGDLGLPQLPYFDQDTSMRMSNAINASSYCLDKEYNYYGEVSANGTSGLWKNASSVECEVLAEGIYPVNLQYYEDMDAFYFIDPEDARQLWRYDIPSNSFSKQDVNCFSYSLDGGKIYYVDEGDLKLYSYDLGSKERTKILDKTISDCFVYEGWAIYVDLADSTIHAFDVEKRVDYKLTETASLCPIIDGNTMYYVDTAGDNFLHSLNLKDGREQVFEGIWTYEPYYLTTDYIYFYDANHGGLAYSVSRNYMKTEGSETGFETYMLIDGTLLWAERYEYIFVLNRDLTENPYENYYRIQNYYDGDVSYWPINWELYGYDL